MNRTYATLDMKKIQAKPSKVVSTAKALKDVEKIKWNKDVLEGRKKVIVVAAKRS